MYFSKKKIDIETLDKCDLKKYVGKAVLKAIEIISVNSKENISYTLGVLEISSSFYKSIKSSSHKIGWNKLGDISRKILRQKYRLMYSDELINILEYAIRFQMDSTPKIKCLDSLNNEISNFLSEFFDKSAAIEVLFAASSKFGANIDYLIYRGRKHLKIAELLVEKGVFVKSNNFYNFAIDGYKFSNPKSYTNELLDIAKEKSILGQNEFNHLETIAGGVSLDDYFELYKMMDDLKKKLHSSRLKAKKMNKEEIVFAYIGSFSCLDRSLSINHVKRVNGKIIITS